MRLSLRSFSKYIPPDVVRMLVNSGLEANLGAQKRTLTVCCLLAGLEKSVSFRKFTGEA